uniref:hypothetical protein n=1 Tax=Candidatus Enterococcus willemsii TaxID=1857215 RepID=UPI00403F6BC3
MKKDIARAIYLSSAFFMILIISYLFGTNSAAFAWVEWLLPIILIVLAFKVKNDQ